MYVEISAEDDNSIDVLAYENFMKNNLSEYIESHSWVTQTLNTQLGKDLLNIDEVYMTHLGKIYTVDA